MHGHQFLLRLPPVVITPELPVGFQLPMNMIQLQQEDANLADNLQGEKENEGRADLEHDVEGLIYCQHRS